MQMGKATQDSHGELIDLETRFWQSMVDNDADTAVEMLNEPALMVSSHGAMSFDHAAYRRMAAKDSMVLTSFELNDMKVVFPNESTAILTYKVTQGMAPRGQEDRSTKTDMYDTSTWIRSRDGWHCVMHTETPAKSH
jgi:hypothetical protein